MKLSVWHYLDRPKMIIGMEMGNFLCIAGPLGLGVCFRKTIMLGILGLILLFLRNKCRRSLPKHYLVGWFYWMCPPKLSSAFIGKEDHLPPSHQKIYMS